jgi:hypothetical protein
MGAGTGGVTQVSTDSGQVHAALHAVKAENELAFAYAGYGRLLAEHGQRSEGRAHLARALAIFEHLGTIGEPDKVRQALLGLPT